jgi:putative transposase
MPREARMVGEDAIYHVMCRGNNKVKIFHVGHDYRKYISNLLRYKELCKFKIYAFALLPNHLHMLIQPKSPIELSSLMRSLSISYSVWHNRRYDCVGHVWQDRFKSRIINDDNDFIACMLYIEMNPVRAGLTDRPQEYKWSSCSERFSKRSNILIDFHPIYLQMGLTEQERRRAYYEIMFRDGTQAQQCVLKYRP